MTSEFEKWYSDHGVAELQPSHHDAAEVVKAAFAEVERRAKARCDNMNVQDVFSHDGPCYECVGIATKKLQQEWFGGKSEG